MYIAKEISAKASKRSSVDTFPNFDLEKLISVLKYDRKWEKGGMNMMILLKSPSKKIILAILHDKTEIRSHQVDDSITFQIIRGQLLIHLPKKSFILNRGEKIKIDEKARYSINSVEETVFLMTLAS